LSGPLTGSRDTQTFPVVQRTSIRFFRRITRNFTDVFRDIGARSYFLRDIARAFGDPATYAPETIRQMKNIGVDSVPLTVIVAAFIGGVIALQTRYQLLPGVQLSIIGLASRLMVVLELGPLLTGLVLTGRVGGRMTAEIGTMRVTEQIDALETLAYDPVAYLMVPRVIAGVTMVPMLTIVAIAVGICAGGLAVIGATDVRLADYSAGLHLTFNTFQVWYALIKATLFGGAIAMTCSYEGFITGSGAEGVGRSTARAVVISSVVILLLDALTALYLAKEIQ
jgi:phospholipid/cholesterol/gamma-HCH transport system permease protein